MEDLRNVMRGIELSLKDIPRQIGVTPKAVLQLVAGFDRARRRAVGRPLGMGGNDGGKARDAMMCAVVRKFRYGRVERDRGAQRRGMREKSRACDQLRQ